MSPSFGRRAGAVDARRGSTRSSRASIAASRARPSARSWSTSGRSKPAAVAASIRRCAQRGSSGSSGRSRRSARRAGAERQVALRVGGDRVEIDPERTRREWRSPTSACERGEVAGDELALAELDEPVAERAAVERVAPASREGGAAPAPRRVGARGPRAGWPARRARRVGARRRDRAGRARRRAAGWPGSRRRPAPAPARGVVRPECSPNRAWSAIHPSTHPGTVTDRTSSLNGIADKPSARIAAGSAPEPARPLAFSATTSLAPDRSSRWTMANRSPPMPQRCGAVTASTAFVAIAASTALPPSWNAATPADVAR